MISFEEPAALPFEPARRDPGRRREVTTRVGRQRFKFRVLKRYGPACAVFGVDGPELLDAAHLRPVQEDGTDDPRNGLVLCATHHLQKPTPSRPVCWTAERR